MKETKQNRLLTLILLLVLAACTRVSVASSTSTAEPTNIAIMSTPEIVVPVSTITPTPPMWEYGTQLTFRLNDMTILPEMEVWAVGDPGIVLHDYYRLEIKGLHEEQNSDLDLRTLGSLIAVDFISSNDGWIASSLGGIFHWNGTEWKTIIPANPDAYHFLRDIKFADTDNGWAVGCLDSAAQNSSDSSGDTPVMLQWNGAHWDDISALNNLGINDCLYSIDVISENDVWILGDNITEEAIVLHWNGVNWQRIPAPEAMHGRNNISASGDTNVWIVAETGNFGTNAFYWNGDTWRKMEIPYPDLPYLYAKRAPYVLALASDDVWVAGSGIFHWNGKNWKIVVSPDEMLGFVIDIEKTPDDTIWALTTKGTILQLANP